MIYQFVRLTTGLHQVSDEVVCACVCACVRACVRPSMRVCVCVRVVSQPNHYTLKTVMTVLRNSCILLLHVLCRRVLASCWIKHTYFPFLVTLVLCLEHQLITPLYVLFPITAVAPPPHTPGSSRKWVMLRMCVCESVTLVCASLFCILISCI